MKKPKKWTEVYPQGTKEGDEEQRFFIALARHPEWPYRSTSVIVDESGLPVERVEELIEKYLKMGLIFSHDTNEDHWIYWERAPEVDPDILKTKKPLVRADQDRRIKKYLSQTSSEEDIDID